MMRLVAGVLASIFVAVPLEIRPAPLVVAAAVPAALLCAVALGLRSGPVLAAGVSVALFEYTVAIVAGPPRLVSAVTMGVALLLLLMIADFAGRSRGVDLDRAVIVSQVRAWLSLAGATAAAVTASLVIGGALGSVLPASFAPAIAAVGVVTVLLGVVSAVRAR